MAKLCRPYDLMDGEASSSLKALSSLRERTDIIIKPANKGLATVVMSKDDYLTTVMSHLDNKQFYEKLSENPTERFSEDIRSILKEMAEKKLFDKDTFDFLQPKESGHPGFIFYQKYTNQVYREDLLYRPVGAPTENISFFVDHHLSPLVKKIPSYVKIPTTFF